MKNRLRLTVAVAAVAGLAVTACGSSSKSTATTTGAGATTAASTATTAGGASLTGTTIIVGSANFPEGVLLGEIYAQALEAKGAKISRKLNLGNRETYFAAMKSGDIQLIPEYTNSLSSFMLKAKNATPTATNVEQQITEITANLPDNLTVLSPSKAEDKDVIVCNKAAADKYSLKTLDDLGKNAANITLAGPPEFKDRTPFGLAGFETAFNTKFKSFVPLEIGQPVADAIKADKAQCGNLFSTDPFIASDNLVPLSDTKPLVPNEAVLPLIAKDKATDAVKSALNAVSAKLDTPGLTTMMVDVSANAKDPAVVAKTWLTDNGLLK
ncbi:MAG: osmoprotectant transport system substrate-binding protein [Acidimicrobiaceae bacterium]|jgi:osmoprotectant transport system substrate-binding protein|nr:osmoprotectant transport system substrate-binding protein [Acidimicrobiaceae bacterium]